ncbi:MAG TPA: carbohydrate ABC transporter permease [Clostridiaceae bacterium]|nr:carbohydrate ABC transporter permease [Clostridiaceae bacterium]
MRVIRKLKYGNKADLAFDSLNYILMFGVLVIVLYPLIYVVSASFSDPYKVSSGEMWLLPKGFTLEGYKRLFNYSEIWLSYLNTIYYTVVGTAFNLAVTLPCAYSLSRKDFQGKGLIMLIIVITMFFSGGLIPSYINIKNLKLLNTRLIIIIGGATSAYNIIVSRTFFSTTIPIELQEASKIDGCSNWKLFLKIVLPLSKPLIAVMALFFGVGHWNSYFGPMIYLRDRKLFPLQLILREILIQSKVSAEMVAVDSDMALAVEELARISEMIKYTSIIVATVPMLVLYVFLQKYFVKGVMIGAIKG